jgi:hypothetical protein
MMNVCLTDFVSAGYQHLDRCQVDILVQCSAKDAVGGDVFAHQE